MSYYIRTSQPPEAMLATFRRTAEQTAPGVPISTLRTMEQQVDGTLGTEKQMATLATVFGLLATLLAAVGLYGVMAYTVARRSREIGIRMALGAGFGKVVSMVMREVGWVVALGIAIGIPTGLAMGQLIRSQLYNVTAADPVSIVTAALVVTAVASFAAWCRRGGRLTSIRCGRYVTTELTSERSLTPVHRQAYSRLKVWTSIASRRSCRRHGG